MANPYLKKPIIELDKPGGNFLRYWESSKAASDFYNISQVVISYNINKKTKQAKGHYFRYATQKEIEGYGAVKARIEVSENTQPAPIEPVFTPPDLPAATLPESPQVNEEHDNTESAFTRLLQESKKKFNENSK